MNVSSLPLGVLATNCYILSAQNEAVVIDPAGNSEKILDHLNKNGLTLNAVLLTHSHFDHIGAVDELCSMTNAPLFCPLYDAPGLTDPLLNASSFFGRELIVKTVPTRLLKDGEEISFGNERLTVLSTPGHTAGGCCYLAENALFAGDTLFHHSHGRTDLPGADEETLFSSLRKIFSIPKDLTVFSGHGIGTTLDTERRYFGV